MANKWDPPKYIELIEKSSFPPLQEFLNTELAVIKGVDNPREKTFIEIGAGYGRVIPQLSEIAKKVIAIELDKEMFNELRERGEKYPNVLVIEGDAQQLFNLLKNLDIQKPVLLSLCNTLGTLVGNSLEILSKMVKVAKDNKGEIIISIYTQESLKEYGIPMYNSTSALSGEPDLEKIDFQKGNFISKTGYQSHYGLRWLK